MKLLLICLLLLGGCVTSKEKPEVMEKPVIAIMEIEGYQLLPHYASCKTVNITLESIESITIEKTNLVIHFKEAL